MVHGEVLFPNAVPWQEGTDPVGYIDKVGGFTQGAGTSKVVVMRPNGLATLATDATSMSTGDKVMVLPKIDWKNIEITQSLAKIFYEIALDAKMLLVL